MRILKLLTPLLLFIIGGVYGIFSKGYIEINKPIFKWFIIAAFPIGIYYAFCLTSNYAKNKNGLVALGRIGITLLVTMFIYRSIQGYLILYNCNIGKQTEFYVKGRVIDVAFPKPKKLFDKNLIDVLLSDLLETITLEVPTTEYSVGQIFEKDMIRGSLDILYSSK
jgi:hypothetical protein